MCDYNDLCEDSCWDDSHCKVESSVVCGGCESCTSAYELISDYCVPVYSKLWLVIPMFVFGLCMLLILSFHFYFCFDNRRKEKARNSEIEFSKSVDARKVELSNGSFVRESGLVDYREQPGEEVEGKIDYPRPEGLSGEPTDPIFDRPGSTNRGDDYPVFEDDYEGPGQPERLVDVDSFDLVPSLPREIKESVKTMSVSKGRSISLGDFSSEENQPVRRGVSIKL